MLNWNLSSKTSGKTKREKLDKNHTKKEFGIISV